jgi:acetate kinase
VLSVKKKHLLTINAGSSSIKFALYSSRETRPFSLSGRGEIENISESPRIVVSDSRGKVLSAQRIRRQGNAAMHDFVSALMGAIESHFDVQELNAAGHRVALGGLEHSGPVLLTCTHLGRLRALAPLAPLHQPHNLEPIEALWKLHPELPQVACFDTAFHRTVPAVAELYGLPRKLTEAGARRYGFHGISYEYIAGELSHFGAEAAAGRTIVAHLGSGASLCALQNGRSVATTMGFSPLSGLVMGTRPGELDPGVLFWLMRDKDFAATDLETMLYSQSGLLGVSGISGDMRVLLASADPRAREAVDLFIYRICREIGSLTAALRGIDALVFTGGIGEHAAPVREAVSRQCAWLGVDIDEVENRKSAPLISTSKSKVRVWVIPTDEELMIARHTAAMVFLNEASVFNEVIT